MNAKASATKVCPGCSARYPPDALFCPNDGTPLTQNNLTGHDWEPAPISSAGVDGQDPYVGRELSGHIEIRSVAGVGAMGRVYRAFQKGIDRDVAVKVLHRELSANQQLVARFHREAKVASRLQHPNVVQVHLAGQLPDGAMYIVMEYLDGLSLQAALAEARGPFPLQRALHIALQICDAAGEGHAQGVIHRDIKPENIMLIRRGDDPDFVKVLDFGIARLNWGEQSMATAAGLIFGTARYISPEGAQGEAVGPEGDVYATATLLYQMLAGRTPFEGDQAVALLIQQIHDAPPQLRSIPAAANVPESVASVIMRNLSKVPAERAPDARTFGRMLVDAARGVGLLPEDLVPRSSLFVPHARLSDPSPPLPPRPSAPPAPTRVDEPPRDLQAHDLSLGGVVQASMAAGGAAQKTKLWTPPAAGSADRSSSVPPLPSAPQAPSTVRDAAPPRAAYTSNVDRTLDESSDVRAPVDSPPRVRTEPALPIGLTPPPPPADPHRVAPPPPIPTARPPMNSEPMRHAGGLAALVDEEEQVPPRRILGVIVLCLVVGILGAAVVLYQLGMVGASSRGPTLDDVVAHADEALKHARWDEPAGDNVRDITGDGLTRWPHDPRLLEVRARATDELVKEAVGRKFAGDLPAALHLARLAKELDPTDTTAQHLVDDYERTAKTADAATSASGASGLVAQPLHVTPPRLAPPGVPTGKVVIEASVAHPHVSQTVTFTAKVSGATGPAKSIDDPRFVINGPGLGADTKLGAAMGGGGSYSATFAGFEPGKYELAFDAKVDGTVVRGVKPFLIDGDPTPPPLPSASTAPTPSSTPSGKWL